MKLVKSMGADANPALFLAMGIFVLAFIVLFSMQIPESHAAQANVNAVKDTHSPMSFRPAKIGRASCRERV